MTVFQRLKYHSLEQQYHLATDEERVRIKQQMAALRKKPAPAPETKKGAKDTKSSSSEGPKKGSGIPPLEKLPHADYCEYVEVMTMARVDGKWMSYRTYRETPGRNVFDLDPVDIDVMYLNQGDYANLGPESLDDPQSVLKCVHKIPKIVDPIAVQFINGLLFFEAKYDARIKKLGYEPGEKMDECEQLCADFFNGVIYNVLHNKMTLEEARHFVETDEMPGTEEEAEESEQPTEGTEPEKDAKPEEGTGTSQPTAAQSQSTTKSTSKDSAKKPKKPAPAKSNQDHIRDLL